MNSNKRLKEIFITILVISLTSVGYAALSTVSSGDSLTSILWNDLIGVVNQNESNIISNINSISTNNDKLSGVSNSGGDISINGYPLSKVFHIKSSTSSVKCINVNYAPTGYTDDECIWLLNGYAFYEGKTQDTFSVYNDSSCTSLYSVKGLMEVKYMDAVNTNKYMKLAVVNGFHSELLCQKGLKYEQVGY